MILLIIKASPTLYLGCLFSTSIESFTADIIFSWLAESCLSWSWWSLVMVVVVGTLWSTRILLVYWRGSRSFGMGDLRACWVSWVWVPIDPRIPCDRRLLVNPVDPIPLVLFPLTDVGSIRSPLSVILYSNKSTQSILLDASFTNILFSKFSTPIGTVFGYFTSSTWSICINLAICCDLKGQSPNAISYSTTPNDQISAFIV